MISKSNYNTGTDNQCGDFAAFVLGLALSILWQCLLFVVVFFVVVVFSFFFFFFFCCSCCCFHHLELS